jgi:hypothetical protein
MSASIKGCCIDFLFPLKYNTITMKKSVLIIRSVSYQQLDKNIVHIKETFPNSELYLLTHSHGVEGAKKYGLFSEIFDYETRKNFSFFHVPQRLKKRRFGAVVVPVTNKTGSGFLNVFLLAARLKTDKIYRCNLISDIREISRWKLTVQTFRAIPFCFVSWLFTLASVLIVPFILLVSLMKGKRKS